MKNNDDILTAFVIGTVIGSIVTFVFMALVRIFLW